MFPSLSYLHKRLDYNPITGIFLWNRIPELSGHDKSWNTRYAEKPAGYYLPTGYLFINVGGHQQILAHRLAWYMTFGECPRLLDHVNQDRTLNSIANLRPASRSENGRNRGKQRDNKSGFKGVCATDNGAWKAYIKLDGASRCLGVFDTAEAAHEAYCEAAALLHGEFACTD